MCNVLKFIYFCKTLYMFQTVIPSIIRSSKLHIQCQVFVRPLLLPAASSRYRLTKINKLWNFASFWLYTENILATHGPMNVKFKKIYPLANL